MALPPPPRNSRFPADLSPVGREFDRWLETHGRWIVYAYVDQNFPCVCYDENTQSSLNSNHCPYCFGSGHKTMLMRMKGNTSLDVRKTYSNASGISPAYVGEIDATGGILYLRSGTNPSPLDMAFEVEWDVPYNLVSTRGTPVRYIRGWKIKNCVPVIAGSEGTPDLWLCGLEEHSLEHDYIEALLRGAGDKIFPPGGILGITPRQGQLPNTITYGSRYRQQDRPSTGFRTPRLPRP